SPQLGEQKFHFFHPGGFTHVSTRLRDFSARITQRLIDLDNSIPRAFALECCLSSTHSFPRRFPFPTLVGGGDRAHAFRYYPGRSMARGYQHWLCHYFIVHNSLFKAEFPAPRGNLLLSSWMLATHPSYTRQSKHRKYALCQIGLKILGPHGFGFAILNRYISPAYRCTVISRAFRAYSSPSALLIGSLIKYVEY
ncbi:hypothetical protein CY34DRAFT_784545, partial [Suillus luteus UH-Slu-Lm8-n1]